ncbi:uncharacterized protein LOC141648156 [Silene latifolia]|uniref:uncharacterized protein LOC141648156 n=1 Tax=Silene latifolia TaxID=37657 RepID=UPI003D772597
MDESSGENESLHARIQQLEQERDELQKDIEKLCMEKAGPSYISLATQTYFRSRTAGLEQEVENLKNKLAGYVKQNSDIKDELSEAKRIKTHLDQLHKLEVSKNVEVVKQLEYLRAEITKAFSDRDHAVMEAEKAKESEELMCQRLDDAETSLQELRAGTTETEELVMDLRTKIEKQDQEIENCKKVIDMFYNIRQHAYRGGDDEESGLSDLLEDVSLHDKCASLYDDSTECWSFNVHQRSASTNYVAALHEEVETLRGSIGDLQHKLQMGWEIEKHLKNRISILEQKKILSDRDIIDGISSLREYHNQQRVQIVELLSNERSFQQSVVNSIEQEVGKLYRDTPAIEETSSSTPTIAQGTESSETLARALHEKVSALILLSQQEERHILEENVHNAVQETVDELQRNLKLATEEKVKALLELAEVKQQYQQLLEKTKGPQANLPADSGDRRIVGLGRDGKLTNLLKRTSLRRWLGTGETSTSLVQHKLESEAFPNNQGSNHNIDNARLRIEYVTLKDSILSLERLTSDIRKLRHSLIQVNVAYSSKGFPTGTQRQVDDTIREAEMLKIALSSALPLSWSGEGGVSPNNNVTDEDSDAEKIDPVSAAGLEMAELLILAAQILKEKKIKKERKIKLLTTSESHE